MSGVDEDTPLAYIPTEVSSIQGTLRDLFTQNGPDEQPKVRVGNANFLLLISADDEQKSEEVIRAVSLVHPCRFFLIRPVAVGKTLNVEVATRCHIGQNNHYLCSEVVSLEVPKSQLAALPSVIFAHLLTGMPTELAILSHDTPDECLQELLPLADTVIFDSSLMQAQSPTLASLCSGRRRSVDLSWLKTAPWREQFRELCQRPAIKGRLQTIKTIEIVRSEPTVAGPDTVHSGPYLIGAWMLLSLGYEPVEKSAPGTVRVRSRSGAEALLAFPEQRDQHQSDGIASIRLCLESDGEGGEVQVSRNAERPSRLEGSINMNQCLRLTSVSRDQNEGAVLARWYSGAISCADYQEPLALSLALYKLLRG